MTEGAWIFTTLTWLCLAGFLLLLGRFLLGDRPRGRLRCPKCWYDMGGAGPTDDGAYTCSECGRTARSERGLRKSRRRLGWAVAALAMLIGSYTAFTTPRVVDRGWVGAVPTTVLALSSGALANATFCSDGDPPELVQAACFELIQRLRENRVPGWQRRLMIRNAAAAMEKGRFDGSVIVARCTDPRQSEQRLLNRAVRVTPIIRGQWPQDTPIYVRFDAASWRRQDAVLQPIGGGRPIDIVTEAAWSPYSVCYGYVTEWHDGLTEWDALSLGEDNPRFNVILASGEAARPGMVTIPIHIVESIHDILEPVDDPAIAEAIQSADEPRLDYWGDEVGLFWQNPVANADIAEPITVALRLTVYRGAFPAYTGHAWWQARNDTTQPRQIYIPLTPNPCPSDQPPGPWPWSVIIESDPELALRNFECDRYWRGHVVLEADAAPDLPELRAADPK